MTPEDLQAHIIKDQDLESFRGGFKNLTHKERKALSTTAQAVYKQFHAASDKLWTGKDVKLDTRLTPAIQTTVKKIEFVSKPTKSKFGGLSYLTPEWVREVRNKSILALFAVAPKSAVMKSSFWFYSTVSEILVKILADRNPPWLAEWVDYELEKENSAILFPSIVQLIESGLIEKPETNAYITKYANYIMRASEGWNRETRQRIPAPPISQQLKASPLLMSDAYNVFRVESLAFNTNAWLEKGADSHYESWSVALLKLERDGSLDRNRLLNESLSALSEDLKSNQLSGVAKFHKSLKPTKSELKKREPDYIKLLASPYAPVARLGIDLLSALQKAKALDDNAVLVELPVIFNLSVKTHAMAALKFATRIGKGKPAFSDLLSKIYMAALQHENMDVQTVGLDGLEELGGEMSESSKADLAGLINYVSPHLHTRLIALSVEADKDNIRNVEKTHSLAPSTEVAEYDLSSLSTQNKQAYGFEGLLKSPFTYHPICSDIMQMEVLHTVEPVVPIQSQEELLTAIAGYVETGGRVEGERIADGISRIQRVEDDEFKARVKPLLHRIGFDVERVYIAGGALNHLIYTYLDLKFQRPKSDFAYRSYDKTTIDFEERHSPDAAISGHYRALIRALKSEGLRPRLSAPTHENGWIDPTVWVKRLEDIGESSLRSEKIDLYDLTSSLIRLAPDNRLKAAKDAQNLSGELKALADFTLGVSDLPALTKKTCFEIWVTAARARDPRKDWTGTFAPYHFKIYFPGMLAPRDLRWQSSSKSLSLNRVEFPHYKKSYAPDKKFFQSIFTLDRTLLPASLMGYFDDSRYWWYEGNADISMWQPTLFPLHPYDGYLKSIRTILSRIDDSTNSFYPVHGLMHSLFQKNRPWDDIGHLVLALALFGRDADAQGLAIDALIEGIESGQCDPDQLAQVFTKLSQTDWIKLHRPNPALKQAAEISRLHAYVISTMLQNWLPFLDRKSRGLGDCLESLLFCLSLARLPLEKNMGKYLAEFTGSSKAAKTAKAILKLSFPQDNALTDIQAEAIARRLQYTPTKSFNS